MELPNEVYVRIQTLCKLGDEFAEEDEFRRAKEQYQTAWELLPEPRTQWEAATWILSAMGDVNYFSGWYDAAIENLSLAMRCPNGIGNPFLHLRLGQCEFEIGVFDRAADQLARAYMGAGSEIFDDEDPKYFAFLKTRLQTPSDGW